MSILIRNGRVLDPANQTDEIRDVYVTNGIISKFPDDTHTNSNREIDATGLVVCPGLVDMNTKMGQPAADPTRTIPTESSSALKGGITTVCIQPNTQPVIDTPAMAHLIRENAEMLSGVRILPLGALTVGLKGDTLTNMASLMDAGCVGVSNAENAVQNTLVMRRAMQYAATFDITVFIQSHDPWLTGNGCIHEGEISTKLGLPAIPEAAETVAIARDLALVETTGVHAHFSKLSCGHSVDMINDMKKKDLQVSADVAIHNLHLTERDADEFNTLCHVIPPLRSKQDRDRLRQGIMEGTVSAICSDHQPCNMDNKLAPFSQSSPGISGLETLLSLTLRLVDEDVVDLSTAISLLTSNPARILGINVGTLSLGSQADICIFNPDTQWQFDPEQMLSRGRNSPFHGWKLRGQVVYTISNGTILYERN